MAFNWLIRDNSFFSSLRRVRIYAFSFFVSLQSSARDLIKELWLFSLKRGRTCSWIHVFINLFQSFKANNFFICFKVNRATRNEGEISILSKEQQFSLMNKPLPKVFHTLDRISYNHHWMYSVAEQAQSASKTKIIKISWGPLRND